MLMIINALSESAASAAIWVGGHGERGSSSLNNGGLAGSPWSEYCIRGLRSWKPFSFCKRFWKRQHLPNLLYLAKYILLYLIAMQLPENEGLYEDR